LSQGSSGEYRSVQPRPLFLAPTPVAGIRARRGGEAWSIPSRAVASRRMFNAHVACHLWDLEDEGIDPVLDRLQGELGAGGVSVVAAGRPIRHLRHRPEAKPRIFQSQGGWYFPPDETKYTDTRCKPVVSGWMKSRNPLRKVSEACHRSDMTLRAVVDTRRIGRIVSRCPSAAVKTAFGDASPRVMCPANPDVAALFHDLIADLTANYDVSAIEVRCLDHTFETDLADALEASGSPQAADAVARALLSICFCESCLQSAAGQDIDSDGARRSVRTWLNGALDQSRLLPDSWVALLAEDDVLDGYVRHRRDAHIALMSALSRHCPCDLVLHVGGYTESDLPALSAMAPNCAAINVSVSRAWPTVKCSTLDQALEACRVSGASRYEAEVSVRESLADDATGLVSTVKGLVDRGVAGVHFRHYDLMGDRGFKAVQQAIRHARRSASV